MRYTFDRMPAEALQTAVKEWLTEHGVDPNDVAVPGWIELNYDERQVGYLSFVWCADDSGRRIPQVDPRTGDARTRVVVRHLEQRPRPLPLAS